MQAHSSAHAYFKSTDGHHGNWSFNLRRPNIHLLSVAASHGGYVHHDTPLLFPCKKKKRKLKFSTSCSRLILVDSTRAGKRLPDALSKTVPIWCAVVNRAITLRGGCFDFDVSSGVQVSTADTDTDLDLHTPPGAVSPHEHVQIAARLDFWAAALAVSYACRNASCPPLLPPQCPHRTRRMHSLNWIGRCAHCGSRPLRRASLISRTTPRSCLLCA